jgi:hypothetical protein
MTKKWNGFTLSCTMNHYNMLGLSIKKPDAANFSVLIKNPLKIPLAMKHGFILS